LRKIWDVDCKDKEWRGKNIIKMSPINSPQLTHVKYHKFISFPI